LPIVVFTTKNLPFLSRITFVFISDEGGQKSPKIKKKKSDQFKNF